MQYMMWICNNVIACFVGISYFPKHYILGTRNELQDFAL